MRERRRVEADAGAAIAQHAGRTFEDPDFGAERRQFSRRRQAADTAADDADTHGCQGSLLEVRAAAIIGGEH